MAKELLPDRVCAYPPCGETFIPKREDHRFHTEQCRLSYWHESVKWVPHSCPLCTVIHDPDEAALLDALELQLRLNVTGPEEQYIRLDVVEAFITRRREVLSGVTRPLA